MHKIRYQPPFWSVLSPDDRKQKWQNIFHVIVNANAIVEHIQIKNTIIKHVDVNVKVIISMKNIIVGILAHVFVRIASI